MQYITQATENRVAKAECKYADILRYLLRTIKGSYGCDGATIKDMKGWGIRMRNSTQISVYESPELRGMCYTYNDYINYVGTHNLSHVNILDFNGLVKAVIAGNGKHNGYKG